MINGMISLSIYFAPVKKMKTGTDWHRWLLHSLQTCSVSTHIHPYVSDNMYNTPDFLTNICAPNWDFCQEAVFLPDLNSYFLIIANMRSCGSFVKPKHTAFSLSVLFAERPIFQETLVKLKWVYWASRDKNSKTRLLFLGPCSSHSGKPKTFNQSQSCECFELVCHRNVRQ